MIDTNSPAVASGTNDSYTLLAQIKERPILFSGAMVRAILDGKKTQTRRVIKPQPLGDYLYLSDINPQYACFTGSSARRCPYGKVGDRLWVRETFCIVNDREFGGGLWVDYRATPRYSEEAPAGWENAPNDIAALKWKPSIHMPKGASRINLEITNIRVERIQDISDNDIEFEGVEVFGDSIVRKTLFTDLWNKINKKRGYGWDKNPWVWVVTFKRV